MVNKILIVDDDEYKTINIKELLERSKKCKELANEKTLNSGLCRIRNEKFDLILLDMSMPTFETADAGNYNSFGGLIFLEEMKRIRNNTPVIILTQYEIFGEGPMRKTSESIDSECKNSYSNYKGIIIYSSIQNTWKEQLIKMLGE